MEHEQSRLEKGHKNKIKEQKHQISELKLRLKHAENKMILKDD